MTSACLETAAVLHMWARSPRKISLQSGRSIEFLDYDSKIFQSKKFLICIPK